MKTRNILILAIILFVALLALTYTFTSTMSEEDKVTGVTKESYMKVIEKNCPEEGVLTLAECRCAYSYLIDNYGIDNTRRMDVQASRDANNIDERMYIALERCL